MRTHTLARSSASLFALVAVAACGGADQAPGTGFQNKALARAQLVATMTSLASIGSGSSDPGDGGIKRKVEGCLNARLDCPDGGSFELKCGDNDVTIKFDDCHAGGQSLDGSMTARQTATTLEIVMTDLTAGYGDCGVFQMNGRITGDPRTGTLGYDVTVASGPEHIHIEGALTVTSKGIDGMLDYSGAVEASCDFNDTPATCPAIAAACGLRAGDVCAGSTFRDDICNTQ